MSDSYRRSLFVLLSLAVMTMFATAAAADCYSECDPYTSSCSQSCDVCVIFSYDGCDQWESSTCGEHSAGCIADNCTPSWTETARTNVGTYDGNSFSSCTHHKVDSVTLTDGNHCNTNSSYYSYTYCDDYIDDYKNNCCFPSCCSGYGELGHYLTCNGYHSCS